MVCDVFTYVHVDELSVFFELFVYVYALTAAFFEWYVVDGGYFGGVVG